MTYGMPYMGSKQTIVQSLALNFPKAEHFYDLFGGGGSVTHYLALRSNKFKHFHYNEIDSLVVNLFNKAINGDYCYSKFKPDWISREGFFARKDVDGYIKYIWSFGNTGSDYLYSKEIEQYKKSTHNAVVFDDFNEFAFTVLGFNKWPSYVDSIKKRRLYLGQKIEWYNINKKIPNVLHQFLSEEQIKQIGIKDNVKRLERLEILERLERLQQLEQLHRLNNKTLSVTNLDYRSVTIEKNSVVYCDIPYIDKKEYANKFNHKEFYEWALTRDFPVYISEYSMPKEFKTVYTIEKIVLLSSQDNRLKSQEKLYWNGK